MNQNDGEGCPGSAVCSETRGRPLHKYLSRQTESEICAGCTFLPTKSEAVAPELIEYVAVALEISEVQRGGATFAYPTALTPLEWACLKGLTRGRDRAESLKAERERAEAKLKAKKDKLKNE